MMKWGRKKKPSLSPSSSSSSQPHLISHVFPLSWFSRSKQPRGEKPGSRTETITQKGNQNPQKIIPRSPIYSNPTPNNNNNKKYYYTQDDDGFWRLSFGDHEPESNTKQSSMRRRSHRSNKNNPRDEESQEWQKLKEAKIKEYLSKGSEKQRKSFHMPRQSKVKVQSPKTPSKIKSLEPLKKMKMKIDRNESGSLESFAVVKSSRNPEQDFRDSMVEMIMEKRITRHDQLEELLACYLTLNADEYHDLIIRVFREVWIQLEGTCFDLYV